MAVVLCGSPPTGKAGSLQPVTSCYLQQSAFTRSKSTHLYMHVSLLCYENDRGHCLCSPMQSTGTNQVEPCGPHPHPAGEFSPPTSGSGKGSGLMPVDNNGATQVSSPCRQLLSGEHVLFPSSQSGLRTSKGGTKCHHSCCFGRQ